MHGWLAVLSELPWSAPGLRRQPPEERPLTRLRHVVEPRLSGAKRVVDISTDGWIAGFLRVPDGVDLVSGDPKDFAPGIQADDLVVDAVPVPSGEDGFLSHLRTVASHLMPGASAVLLTRDATTDLPLHEIERVTTSVGCQLLEVAELAYREWPAAILVGCGVEPPAGGSTATGSPAVLVRGSLRREPVAPRVADDG